MTTQCKTCGAKLVKRKPGPGRPPELCENCKANKDRLSEQNRQYYQANKNKIAKMAAEKSGMADVLRVERELGIRRSQNTCQTCGARVSRQSQYRTYCSYACYQKAFRS